MKVISDLVIFQLNLHIRYDLKIGARPDSYAEKRNETP